MFESLSAAPPDPILGLSEAFRADSRPDKINLTIGVYMDEHGQTGVLECVKEAESRLLTNETTKGYLGMTGLPAFGSCIADLVIGDLYAHDRATVTQTPGGTGALRVAGDFLSSVSPSARIWLSTPTWPNHAGVFSSAGLEILNYPYLSEDRRSLDFAALLEYLQANGRAGDVICLHACCHNPTGVDPTPEQWDELSKLTAELGMLPLVDFAYHGFGDSLEADRRGLVALAAHHEELLICSSYSKNFGLYSERVGALTAVSNSAGANLTTASRIKQAIRSNYSNPPRHGGAIVATVLQDPELRATWEGELAVMRSRIHAMRSDFVDAMRETGCETDYSFLLKQRGMFSFSGLTPMQVDWLKTEKGIYIVGSGRINVAGITPDNLPRLAVAIAEALRI